MSKQNNLKDFIQGLVDAVADKKGLVAGTINAQDLEEEIRSIQGTGDSNDLTEDGELVYNPLPTVNEDGELVFQQKMYIYDYELTDKLNSSDATATANDILLGKTAYVNNKLVTGTIETYDYSVYEGGDSSALINALISKEITNYTADSVTKIGPYAFGYCTKLKEFIIGKNVTSIGGMAFYRCDQLENVYYLGTFEDWNKISEGWLASMSSYGNPMGYSSNFYLKDNDDNFYEIPNEFTVPDTLTQLNTLVFAGNKKLNKININNVEKLNSGVFFDCLELTDVYCPVLKRTGDMCFNSCEKLKSVYIPLCTYIDIRTFQSTYSLTKILIEQAEVICTLSNTSALSSSYHYAGRIHSTYNPEGLKDGYVYVPATRLAEYKVATNWSVYATQIIGHQDFNVGDTLPNYTNETFTTQTWYSDETLTQAVTSVTTAGRYYCRLEA